MNLFDMIFKLLTATPTPTTDTSIPELIFNPKGFIDMLGYMGKGMLVIFVLIGVIILVTLLINKVFSKK